MHKHTILIVFGKGDESLADFYHASGSLPRGCRSRTSKELSLSGVVVLTDGPVESDFAHCLCSHTVDRAGELIAVAILLCFRLFKSPSVLMDILDFFCGFLFQQSRECCASKVCCDRPFRGIEQTLDAYCGNLGCCSVNSFMGIKGLLFHCVHDLKENLHIHIMSL